MFYQCLVYVLPVFIVGLLFASACGKKSDDSNDESNPTVTAGQLRLTMVSPGAAGSGSSLNLADPLAVSFTEFTNNSIASGAPESMSVSIKTMRLKNSLNNAETTIFTQSDGKIVNIDGARVDLSGFFTKIECLKSDGTVLEVPEGKSCKCGVDAAGVLIDAESVSNADGSVEQVCPAPKPGEVPPFGVLEVSQAGEYDTLVVSFANKGEAKGCVEGKFAAGSASYCTKTGQDLDSNQSFSKADYPSSSATESSIYWSKAGKGETEINKEFPIGSMITIGESIESPKLTMVIDRGRMLRFFDGSNSNGPNPVPGLPGSKAYFFSTVFEDSTYVFVGQPGKIRGYRYALRGINGKAESEAFPAAGSRDCDGSIANNCAYVNGWLTIIEDASGSPFVANLMPDDDNARTLAKGGNYDPSKPGKILKDKLEVQTDGSWQLNYNLLNQGKTKGLLGTIYGLKPEMAVGNVQTTEFTVEQTDDSNQKFRSWGAMTLQRAL